MDNTIVIVTILGPPSLQNFPPNFPLALLAKLDRSQLSATRRFSSLTELGLTGTGVQPLSRCGVSVCWSLWPGPEISTAAGRAGCWTGPGPQPQVCLQHSLLWGERRATGISWALLGGVWLSRLQPDTQLTPVISEKMWLKSVTVQPAYIAQKPHQIVWAVECDQPEWSYLKWNTR